MKAKIGNRVYRLKNGMVLDIPNTTESLKLRNGEEFHIVNDVLYMQGFPVPTGLQAFLIKWIKDNPVLFVNDTRIF
jgi:hypothetical protein